MIAWINRAISRVPRWFWTQVLPAAVVTRLMLIGVAWLGFYFWPQPVKPEPHKIEIRADGKTHPVGRYISPDEHPLLNMWCRWDSYWYLEIARIGYTFSQTSPSSSAFYPTYPLTLRVVHSISRWPRNYAGRAAAGILVSNISLLVALCYLYRLVRLDFDESIAARSVWYLSIFPMTLFLSAIYTESLFLALTIAAFYYARRQHWITAGILGAFAAAGRGPGVVLAVALAFEYLAQKRFRLREIRWDVLSIGLVPLGVAVFGVYLALRFHEPWAMLKSHDPWTHHVSWPWQPIWRAFHDDVLQGDTASMVDLLSFFSFVVLSIFAALRLRGSYTVYAIISLLFVLSFGFLSSMPRYGLVVFPFIIILALFGRNPVFHRSYIIVSSVLAAYFMIIFSQWGWVA